MRNSHELLKKDSVDLDNLKVGDTVHLANGGSYVVGYIRKGTCEDGYGGYNPTYRLQTGKGTKHSWGYENYSEVIGGGRYSQSGTNERHPHEVSGIKIVAITKKENNDDQ